MTLKHAALAFLTLVAGPLGASCVMREDAALPWYERRRDSSGQAPDPATDPEAVVQVYAARTVGWRGIFGVHTWIVLKPPGAPRYSRYEVIGWGVEHGIDAIRVDRGGPDNYWFGARPEILLDRRGADAERIIPQIRRAIADYPYPHDYRLWPGPNSNTFLAHIGRQVPGLGLDLPATAVGKDWLPGGQVIAPAPSNTGYQFSLLGVAGILLAAEEGLELNLLGLTFGIDVKRPAVKLPGVGRLGMPRA